MRGATIFDINQDGELVLNKPEIRQIPQYNALLRRDKGSEGDFDGKKKRKAFAELLYVYLLTDPRSMYYVLPLSERRVKAKIHTGLGEGYKEDDELKDAVLKYEADLKLNSVANSYLAAERYLYMVSEDVHNHIENIQEFKLLLSDLNKKVIPNGENRIQLGDVEKINIIKDATIVLERIVNIEVNIAKIIKDLPNYTKTTQELAAAYAQDGGSFKVVVGGGELGNREE